VRLVAQSSLQRPLPPPESHWRGSPPDPGNRVADVDPRPKVILGGAFDFESRPRSEAMFLSVHNGRR